VASDGTQVNDGGTWPAINGNGSFVAFMSGASNLVPGDTNGIGDIFVHELGLPLTPLPVVHDIELVDLQTHGPGVRNGGSKTHVVVVRNAGTVDPDMAWVTLTVSPNVAGCSAQVDDPDTLGVETASSLTKTVALGAGRRARVEFQVIYACSGPLDPDVAEFSVTADAGDAHGLDVNPANDTPITESQDVRG